MIHQAGSTQVNHRQRAASRSVTVMHGDQQLKVIAGPPRPPHQTNTAHCCRCFTCAIHHWKRFIMPQLGIIKSTVSMSWYSTIDQHEAQTANELISTSTPAEVWPEIFPPQVKFISVADCCSFTENMLYCTSRLNIDVLQ